MKEAFIIMAIMTAIICLIYILYLNGFAVVNRKSALFYIGSPRLGQRKNCIEAKFVSCNGTIKRVIRLSPWKRYRFAFSSSTTKGAVSIEIYGKKKEMIAVLNNEHPCTFISTEERTNCRVVTKFMKADGQYKLIWNEV